MQILLWEQHSVLVYLWVMADLLLLIWLLVKNLNVIFLVALSVCHKIQPENRLIVWHCKCANNILSVKKQLLIFVQHRLYLLLWQDFMPFITEQKDFWILQFPFI